MKIMVTCTDKVKVEIEETHEGEVMTYHVVIAALEMAKMEALSQWREAMDSGGAAEQADSE